MTWQADWKRIRVASLASVIVFLVLVVILRAVWARVLPLGKRVRKWPLLQQPIKG